VVRVFWGWVVIFKVFLVLGVGNCFFSWPILLSVGGYAFISLALREYRYSRFLMNCFSFN